MSEDECRGCWECSITGSCDPLPRGDRTVDELRKEVEWREARLDRIAEPESQLKERDARIAELERRLKWAKTGFRRMRERAASLQEELAETKVYSRRDGKPAVIKAPKPEASGGPTRCPNCGGSWGAFRGSAIMGRVWDCGQCGKAVYDGE